MATRSNTKGDIDRDLPRKRKNDAADSGQNKKKRKKSQKRFVWKPHLQTLKDKLEDKKYDDPSVENCVEIANEMLPNAPGITGEIVRTKTRTKEIKKFLKSLKRKSNKEKKGTTTMTIAMMILARAILTASMTATALMTVRKIPSVVCTI